MGLSFSTISYILVTHDSFYFMFNSQAWGKDNRNETGEK